MERHQIYGNLDCRQQSWIIILLFIHNIFAMKSRLKKFLLQIQSYGTDKNDLNWYDSNKSISKYLAAIS